MDREYTEKYIAFIDILGFKSVLKEEGDSASRISKLFDAIVQCKDVVPRVNRFTNKRNPVRTLEELKPEEDYFQCYDAALKDIVIKIVSDSIIIAVPVKDEFGFTAIVDVCSYIAQFLLHNEGCFVRGAITRGLVYFENESVFFGEAYIRAYTLEEKNCLYPRIIYENSYDEYPYADSLGRTQTICDEDGWGDVDYIGNYLGTRDDYWQEEREKRLRSIIEWEIKKNKEKPEVCAKYYWVKSQIERAREYVELRLNA